jgi:hypothetical protein
MFIGIHLCSFFERFRGKTAKHLCIHGLSKSIRIHRKCLQNCLQKSDLWIK